MSRVRGIYAIFVRSGDIYVGSSRDVQQRWRKHQYHLSRNRHDVALMQELYNQLGPDAFQFALLERCGRDIGRRELFWMKILSPSLNRRKLDPTTGRLQQQGPSRKGVPNPRVQAYWDTRKAATV